MDLAGSVERPDIDVYFVGLNRKPPASITCVAQGCASEDTPFHLHELSPLMMSSMHS